ncbi:hypothetical protein P7F60_27800 [Rhizobium sp. YJ-22]|uniref:hypothetical protein n=1 Tax=Rhizobium sp. YJ-22 TaxID=3037556 RepID=UPI002412E5BC|nr:hypothetical protein [Rhizobium sp. YJ-22]MDG3580197.1 hypothetical protein [Rhizobium sp. YJ-22]
MNRAVFPIYAVMRVRQEVSGMKNWITVLARLVFGLIIPGLAGTYPAGADEATSPSSLNEDLLNEFTGAGAHIRQAGSGNTATIVQQGGSGNFAFSATDGNDNAITILQSGSGHSAGVIADSDGARVTVDQSGIGHRAGVVAEGGSADISVTQRGANESVTVQQTGPGQAISITQGGY